MTLNTLALAIRSLASPPSSCSIRLLTCFQAIGTTSIQGCIKFITPPPSPPNPRGKNNLIGKPFKWAGNKGRKRGKMEEKQRYDEQKMGNGKQKR